MRKSPQKRTAPPARSGKRAAAKAGNRPSSRASVAGEGGEKLAFNHAMVYVKDVERALGFYRDLLGFKLLDDLSHENRLVYARLRAPGGEGTIALHLAGPGNPVASDGVRLYFEIRELDDFCRKLRQRNFYITQLPALMPWGWRHAYINDPDGHEISQYWAGANRMKRTMDKAARKASGR